MGMGHDGSRLMNDDDVFFVLLGFQTDMDIRAGSPRL